MAEEKVKVEVDKREMREQLGTAPGLPEDSYTRDTHVGQAPRIYDQPAFVVAGALHYAQLNDAEYDEKKLTITYVKNMIQRFLNQEDKSHGVR